MTFQNAFEKVQPAYDNSERALDFAKLQQYKTCLNKKINNNSNLIQNYMNMIPVNAQTGAISNQKAPSFRHHLDDSEMKKVLRYCRSNPSLKAYQKVQRRVFKFKDLFQEEKLKKQTSQAKNKQQSAKSSSQNTLIMQQRQKSYQQQLKLYKKDLKHDFPDQKVGLKEKRTPKSKKVTCQIVLKKRKPDFHNNWNPKTDSQFSSLQDYS